MTDTPTQPVPSAVRLPAIWRHPTGERPGLTAYVAAGVLTALFLIIAAGAGLANPAMYAPFIKSAALLAGLPVQDFFSLLAAPALLAAILYTRRGSVRAPVLWAGLLVFTGYYYAFYAFGYVYTLFYPLYIAITGLSLFALLGLLARIDPDAFAAHIGPRLPVRLLALILGMPLLLVPLWLMGILQGIRTQQAGAADLVFVIDLTFMIPAMILAAVQLWRRRPAGYLLGGVMLVKAALSGLLLTAGSLRQVLLGFPVGPDVAMYIFLLVAGVAGFILYQRHLTSVRPA